MFPLNTVVFPGMRVPLLVFEKRYRRMVRHLLEIDDPRRRLLGTVAIRAGYEVGEHGSQTVHRVGVLLQLTEAVPTDTDGFEIEVLARQRLRVDDMDAVAGFPMGDVELLDEDCDDLATASAEADAALMAFDTYRRRLAEVRGEMTPIAAFGQDPTFLSWALAATTLLPVQHRQSLLEADSACERLSLLRVMLAEEVRAMQAIPSLPALEIARTGWSPN